MKRYKCLLCGRDKFTAKQPHVCNHGFRKHGIVWAEADKDEEWRMSSKTNEKIVGTLIETEKGLVVKLNEDCFDFNRFDFNGKRELKTAVRWRNIVVAHGHFEIIGKETS